MYGNGANAPVVAQNGNTITVDQASVNGSDAYFAYGSLGGDGSISAKLPNVEGSTTGTEIGLEIRESTASNANHVRIARYSKRPIVLIASDIIIPILLPQEESIRVTYKDASGQHFLDYPVGTYQYVKVENIGGNIAVFASSDGMTWTQLGGTIALNISANAVIGFRTNGLIANTTVNYQEITQLGAVPNAATMYYVHADHLGTPQVITNAAQHTIPRSVF